MTTTLISVTGCDNEIYIIASQPTGSSELLHLKSGYNNPVSNTFIPQSILAPGQYTLTMVGINWGGPTGFKVAVTTNGTVVQYPTTPVAAGVGVVWTQSVAITV